MNGLSLRISTVRGSNPVKRTLECKESTIQIEFRDNFEQEDVVEFIRSFSEAETVELQLKVIKRVTVEAFEPDVRAEFLRLYCHIFLNSPVKHPVRSFLAKCIELKEIFKENAALVLTKAIDCLLEAQESTPERLNDTIFSLNDCLSLKVGSEAVRLRLPEILAYISRAIGEFLELLSATRNGSPVFKNEICQHLHNVLRAVISLVQHFGPEAHQNEDLGRICEYCSQIIEHADIPIDTKTNAGLLVVTRALGTESLERTLDFDPTDHIKSLCIAFGILCATENDEKALIWVTQRMRDILSQNILEPCLILCVCRVFVQFSKFLRTYSGERGEEAADLCLDYAISNLDHYMDSVRHMNRDILKNLIEIPDPSSKVVCKLFRQIDDPLYNKNNKAVIITCICQVKGAQAVFDEIPGICSFILSSLEDNSAHNTNATLGACYENLFTSCLTTLTLEAWFEQFLVPLVAHLEVAGEAHEVRKTLESLILKAVKQRPQIVFQVKEQRIPISVMLKSLGMAKKRGAFDKIESSAEKWKGVLSFESIRKAMTDQDDEARMAALALIVEAHKVTDLLSPAEWETVMFFFQYNISTQSPANRQHILGFVRNLFIRLESNLLLFSKNPAHESHPHYRHFLQLLTDFCFGNFFSGANLGRRVLTFKLLIHIADLIRNNPSFDVTFWTERNHKVILESLDDSYEPNKVDALSLLYKCPEKLLQNEASPPSYDEVVALANSLKPADCITAAYCLEYLVFVAKRPHASFDPENLVLSVLKWLMGLTAEAIEVAQGSITRAAQECPMYGLLFCLRHVLSKIEFRRQDEPKPLDAAVWEPFIKDLIEQCKLLSTVVGPIVNNSSPEGHLPNDFGTPAEDQNVTSQMILLCAWRTIKEVSLTLGFISFHCSTELVSVDDLLGIGSHFTTLLSETKHRGAFEQAYVGFSRLCIRFWAAEEEELHTLPMRWLRALVKIINCDSDDSPVNEPTLDLSIEKLCATRRSAGVPFLIQALITTELQIGSSKGLKFCVESFLRMCRKCQKTEARTHSLNVLRSLFRCADLGEAIGEFVAEGFVCAINAYDAESWAERNSATLLFSALMVRVFGVQRSRDSENLCVRNRMTGRIFFLRYSKLFEFFLSELWEAARMTQEGLRSRKLHSILLLLTRLYPSSLEGIESNLQLTRFIPLVSLCGGSMELKTRYLAARVVATFINEEDVLPRISEILRILSHAHEASLNFVHGALLQIQYLVRRLRPGETDEALRDVLESLLEVPLAKIPVLWSSNLDIIFEIFQKLSKTDSSVDLKSVAKTGDFDTDLGVHYFSKKLTLLKFLRVMQTPSKAMLDVFIQNLGAFECEVQETTLNILLLIVNFDEAVENADDFDISEVEIQLVQRFLDENAPESEDIKAHVRNNRELFVLLHSLLKDQEYYFCTVKAFFLMQNSEKMVQSFLNGAGGDYRVLLSMAQSHTSLLRDAIFGCFRTYLRGGGVRLANLDGIVAAMLPDNSERLRLTAAEMLDSVSESYLKPGKVDATNLCTFFWCLFTLLNDDSVAVRNSSAAVAVKIHDTYFKVTSSRNSIAAVGQELLLKVLQDYLISSLGEKDREKAVLVYLGMIKLCKVHLEGDTDSIGSRCFDKNEGNVFVELRFFKLECLRRARESFYLLEKFDLETKNLLEETAKEFNDDLTT